MLQETTNAVAATGSNADALKQMGVDHLAREMLSNLAITSSSSSSRPP